MTNVKICIGTACHLKGSYNVIMCFQQMVEEYNLHDKVALSAMFCTGNCQRGVCVKVNGTLYSVKPETAQSFFEETVMEGIT